MKRTRLFDEFENIPPFLPLPFSSADVQRAESTGGKIDVTPVSLPFLMAITHIAKTYSCVRLVRVTGGRGEGSREGSESSLPYRNTFVEKLFKRFREG